MLVAVLLLFLSGLCWTCYGYCVSRCTKGGGDYDIVQGWCGLAVALGGLCGVLFECASKGRLALPPDASAGTLAALALLGGGIGSCICNSFASKAMKDGPNGLVWAMTQAALLAPFLMGVLLFHEVPSPVRYIGLALVVAAVFLMGTTKHGGSSGGTGSAWVGCTLLALFFGMASQCCCVVPSYHPEWNATVAFRAMAANFGIFIGYLGALALKPVLRRWPTAFECRILVLQAVVSFISNFFLFYKGLDRLTALGAGGLAYPITISVCILGMEAYALVALREKTPPQAFCGIAALLAGILCLSL